MKLFENIDTTTTLLLTPNRRLSAVFTHQYQQFQLQRKKLCWPSLAILPLQSWLQQLWKEFSIKKIAAAPLLLTPQQEYFLWEEILRQSETLLHVSATAELAKSAFGLLNQWEISLNHPGLQSSENAKIFLEWATLFYKKCNKNNWLTHDSLANLLNQKILNQEIILPKKIILIGFSELSPVYQTLFNSAQQCGTEVIHYTNNVENQPTSILSIIDQESEIRLMARWAKQIYSNLSKKKPYTIGCVVPQLDNLRDNVLQIFLEIFSENNTFTADHTTFPFNISAGKNLTEFPVIDTAFELLKLSLDKLSIETLGILFRSPFLGDAEKEQNQRANFDARLRNANISHISLEKLLNSNLASGTLLASCPLLTKRLKNYLSYASQLKKTLSMSEWVSHFLELLKILGWPGERSLNSSEYQVTQRWLEALTECAALDIILPTQTFTKALTLCTQLSAKIIFQPQTPEAPIHILGVLEAAGLPFEHLWVMGLDDTQWPPTPKPNPLIPLRLQKQWQMPHASAERELIYCQRLLEQFQQNAKNIFFSYAAKNADNDLQPSPLITSTEIKSNPILNLTIQNIPAEKIFQHRSLEWIEDNHGPIINENEIIRGGINIFKFQAACPFKAFAEIRLHARSLESPSLGLRALDRGTIAHKALEIFWQDVKDSNTLKQLSHEELQEKIHSCAEQAIEKVTKEKINQRYLFIELQRLKKLIAEWLQFELTRPAFKVKFHEQECVTTIANIPVTLRVDRIDELLDGTHLIIDYKTGKNNEVKNWFGQRLDEPQLPLYCAAFAENSIGIAFAQLHPDQIILKGLSKRDLGIKSIKLLAETAYSEIKIWDHQIQEWKLALEKLGEEFYRGIAHVQPKNPDETCRHCKLQTICRIDEKI